MPSNPLEVDGVRLSDLSPFGWIGLAIVAAGVGMAVNQALKGDVVAGVVIGGILAFIGSAFAYEDATPEMDSTCDGCGSHVRAHSSRDGAAEYVEVHASGTPRRVSLGPLSVVASRHQVTRLYCSGECAAEDDRVLLERDGDQLEPVTIGDDRREGAEA